MRGESCENVIKLNNIRIFHRLLFNCCASFASFALFRSSSKLIIEFTCDFVCLRRLICIKLGVEVRRVHKFIHVNDRVYINGDDVMQVAGHSVMVLSRGIMIDFHVVNSAMRIYVAIPLKTEAFLC